VKTRCALERGPLERGVLIKRRLVQTNIAGERGPLERGGRGQSGALEGTCCRKRPTSRVHRFEAGTGQINAGDLGPEHRLASIEMAQDQPLRVARTSRSRARAAVSSLDGSLHWTGMR